MNTHQTYPQLQMIWPSGASLPEAPLLGDEYVQRPFHSQDSDAYIHLMHTVGWTQWDEAKLEEWLYRCLPNGWVMVWHQPTNQLAATAMVIHDATWERPFSSEIGWVATHPDHRGQGLGTHVSRVVTQHTLNLGYPNIHLFTEHYRLPAIHIYRKLGYVPYDPTGEAGEIWEEVVKSKK